MLRISTNLSSRFKNCCRFLLICISAYNILFFRSYLYWNANVIFSIIFHKKRNVSGNIASFISDTCKVQVWIIVRNLEFLKYNFININNRWFSFSFRIHLPPPRFGLYLQVATKNMYLKKVLFFIKSLFQVLIRNIRSSKPAVLIT